jgi:hypothetical protein
MVWSSLIYNNIDRISRIFYNTKQVRDVCPGAKNLKGFTIVESAADDISVTFRGQNVKNFDVSEAETHHIIFRRDVLWYSNVCTSGRPSV